jgi:nucleotide-binding universal stress UspA family protein
MFKTIVWATDGSDNSDRALPYVKELAEAKGAKVVVAHCRELLTGRAAGVPVLADEPELLVKIRRQVKELQAVGIDAELEVVTASGTGAAHVVAEIAAEAGADVIIVGTRGQSALVGLLVGSVTQRLLHLAHCPVLAVPGVKHARVHEPALAGTTAS